MRVFVAGASGANGRRLVPQLIGRGHQVTGTATSPERAKRVRATGAEAIVLDRESLPEVAKIVGAKPPHRFPVWLARLFAGEALVMMGTESRGASNAKAKREIGWILRYPSWRQGFADVYARPAAAISAPRSVHENAERVASSSR
jgi:nucleoside-diphosphate-sugar epimerase